MDGRTSLFDAEEVDSFRSRRRRPTEGELDTVIGTALTRVRDGDLRIRGSDLVVLARDDVDYEAVVDLLWDRERGSWTAPADVLAAVRRTQAALPASTPMLDRLRVSTSVASSLDPLRFDLSAGGVRRAGEALIVAMVDGLPAVGAEPGEGRLADRLWPRLTRRPSTAERRAVLNAALVLLVDHGLAPSTFGARIAASVRADPYSVVGAGLGVVGGLLHGAASGAVHELLDDAERTGDPSTSVGNAQRRHGTNPGFGHAVYETEDPRYAALMGGVSRAWRSDPRLASVHAVRDVISERTDAIPTVDLALGALSWLAGMERGAGEAIFAIARTAGWLAHGLEEYDEKPQRFRPHARYTGQRITDRTLSAG